MIVGNPLTVTAIDAGLAVPPLLSLALTVIVSAAVDASVSVKVVRSALTSTRVPAIVNVVPPFDEVIVPPPPGAPVFAARTPLLSASTAVKISPDVLPSSAMLTPAIGPGWPTPTVAELEGRDHRGRRRHHRRPEQEVLAKTRPCGAGDQIEIDVEAQTGRARKGSEVERVVGEEGLGGGERGESVVHHGRAAFDDGEVQ